MYISLPRHCMTTTWKCLKSRFMEGLNKWRQNFLPLSKLEGDPQDFTSCEFIHEFPTVLTLIGYPWKFLKAYFSIMSPKFGVKHDTQVKNTAKYAKCSWRERGYFIRDNISPSGVNRTDNTQASPEFTLALHCFINIFFNIFLPWPGDTVRLQLRESSPTFDKVRELE